MARFVLPPLRERREDIPLLVEHFLEKACDKMGKRVEIGEGVLDYMMEYPFPGNIRELENMMEQGVALADEGLLRREDIVPFDAPQPASTGDSGGRRMQDVIDEAETRAIEAALREVDGNKERAAEILGLSPTTLWRKMKRLEIEGVKGSCALHARPTFTVENGIARPHPTAVDPDRPTAHGSAPRRTPSVTERT